MKLSEIIHTPVWMNWQKSTDFCADKVNVKQQIRTKLGHVVKIIILMFVICHKGDSKSL